MGVSLFSSFTCCFLFFRCEAIADSTPLMFISEFISPLSDTTTPPFWTGCPTISVLGSSPTWITWGCPSPVVVLDTLIPLGICIDSRFCDSLPSMSCCCSTMYVSCPSSPVFTTSACCSLSISITCSPPFSTLTAASEPSGGAALITRWCTPSPDWIEPLWCSCSFFIHEALPLEDNVCVMACSNTGDMPTSSWAFPEDVTTFDDIFTLSQSLSHIILSGTAIADNFQ